MKEAVLVKAKRGYAIEIDGAPFASSKSLKQARAELHRYGGVYRLCDTTKPRTK